jgi:hypothetical protein
MTANYAMAIPLFCLQGMANQTADSYWEKDESAPKVKIMVQNISFLAGAQYVQRQLPSVGFQVRVEIMENNLPIPGDLDADSGYKSGDNNRAVAPAVRSQASGSSPSGSNAATVGGEPDDIFTGLVTKLLSSMVLYNC